jgi:iron complex outermembrane receptor protein
MCGAPMRRGPSVRARRNLRPIRTTHLGTKNAPELAPYATVDIMGAYSFDLRGTKATAQLNVDNLLDRTYYTTRVTPSSASFGWSYAAQAYGAPRSFKGSIKVEF